jgi:phytoene desaturase
MSDRRATIVGAGLGGLSAAIHLRRAGFDVAVYEANPEPGGRASRVVSDGFSFDTGPSLLNYPWVFRDLFEAAGVRMEDLVELIEVDPSVRFVWPDGESLWLSSDLPKLTAELERLEPGSGVGLARFLRDAGLKFRIAFDKLVCVNQDNPLRWAMALTPSEFFRLSLWRSLDGELGRFFRSPRIRQAFGAYGMYLGGSPRRLPGMFSILPYGELAHGLWLPQGGIHALVRAVEAAARAMGVVFHYGQRVSAIEARDGAVRGLRLGDGARVDSPLVVSNVDVPTTQRQLLGRPNAKVPRMTPSVMTFYWGIRGDIPNLGHHTIFLPTDYDACFRDLVDRGRIPAEPAFYVSVASRSDPALAPTGCSGLFVLVPLPLISQLGERDWTELTDQVRRSVLDRLETHGIRRLREDLLFERVWTPLDWRDRLGLYDGSAFGATHTLFQMGPFRSPNCDRGLSGMYYVGAGTTPGTGLPMVALGGAMTAQRILSHVH